MHTVKDARVFVESLNAEQQRALSNALLLVAGDGGPNEVDHINALSARLCEAILLARAVSHIAIWRHY